METPITESNPEEKLKAGPSKSPKIHFENLDEIKTSVRKKIMTDLSKILAENQTEPLKLTAPSTKSRNNPLNVEDTDSETENAFPATTLLHQ